MNNYSLRLLNIKSKQNINILKIEQINAFHRQSDQEVKVSLLKKFDSFLLFKKRNKISKKFKLITYIEFEYLVVPHYFVFYN